MSKKTLDPCGHVKLAVSNFSRSFTFYKEIFDTLGYTLVKEGKDSAGWVSCEMYGIWIAQAQIVDHPYKFNSPGLHHLCLKANTKEKVDLIYSLLLKKGLHIFDIPQKYPRYTNQYYAVFFADPDGMKIEVAYY